MYKKITLKNGLRIITVPDKTSKAITVLVLVGTGSKYEKKETNGMSHLLEHMLFKGTQKRPTPISIAEPLDAVGGAYNAFTSEECTGYYAKVESSNFNLALDIISDIYLNSKLDEKELEKEKGVVIEEINMYNDHPSSYVQILWNKVLYGDQPAGWDIAGRKETVSKISREELYSYMKSQYVAKNTVVCIAGDIPSQKEILAKLEKAFKGIKTDSPFTKLAVIEEQAKPQYLLFEKQTDQTHFCLGVRGYNMFDKRRFVQEVLAALLGGMMSSRLFVRIREELSLAYYIRTSEASDTDTGSLTTQSGVDNGKAEMAVAEILKEYKKISELKVSPKELKKAKENIKGKMALTLETSDSQASFYGLQEILKNAILTPADIFKEVDKISSSEILRIAKDMFRPDKLNLAIIGPHKDREKFEKILKI